MARSAHAHIPVEPDRRRRWRRFLLRVLIAAAVLCVLLVAAAIWLSRALPGIVAAEIGRLTNTRVQAGTFGFRLDGSVSVDGLVIRPQHEDPEHDNAILRAKNVSVRVDRRSLVLLSPRVTNLRIEDFTLDAQANLDTGRWNVEGLQFHRSRRRSGGFVIPAIQLLGGKLRYCKVSGGKTEVVMSVPVEARFGEGLAQQGYGFEIKTSKLSGGYGESHLTGYWRPGELALAGGLSSTDLPSLERAWAVDVLAAQLTYEKNGDYALDLHVKDMHGKQVPEVGTIQSIVPAGGGEAKLLAVLQRFLDRYRPTGTVGSIELNARGNLKRLKDSEVEGTLVCEDVSVCDSRFPYTLDHLTGEIGFTQSGVQLKRLAGRHGDVDVQIDGWSKGRGVERQYRYNITTGNMILDEALYAALRPGQKRLWDMFQPTGRVAADYWLIRTSPTDRRMHLSVDLKGVNASFHEFPYPVTDLTGKLYFDLDGVTATNLLSESGSRRIAASAKVTGLADKKPIYYVGIEAANVPLDATLERALPAHYRESFRQLEANGTADMRARVFSTGDANLAGPISYAADVVCNSKSLKLEQLPVILSDVVAEVAVSPDSLNVKRLNGRYGQSPVVLTGDVRLAPDKKSRQYHAKVTAEQVPVDGTTIGLLSKPFTEQLLAFCPQGNVNLTLDLKTPDGNEPSLYSAQVDCLGLKINHERFPYPLENVRGGISLSGDSLVLTNVTASPADPCQLQPSASLCVDGSISLAKGDLTGAVFTVKARDMTFTKALGEALPRAIGGFYRGLSPQGPFDLDVTNLAASRAGSDEMLVEFVAKADFESCDLRVSGLDAELSGVVETEGSYSTRQGLLKGRAQLTGDRLVVKGRAVSNVTAEAVYDPDTRAWSTENLLGDCCRGKVLGSLHVGGADAEASEYRLEIAMNGVDAQQFLQANPSAPVVEDSYRGGVMNAWMSLGGRAGDATSRRGMCQFDIANMRVGKVSLLANLLSVLRLSEPTEYTFERMMMDSYIKQDTLLIRKLDMSGRNVAFTGSGTMFLPTGELNLTLTARGQRLAAADPSIFQALTEGLGSAVVRVEVAGTATEPRVTTKTLPVIEESLRILGASE
ncbi:MAG: hypothetical protein ABFD90_00765 [Phycisphaerales bacterium]